VEALRNGHAAKRVLKRAAGQPAPATPSAPNEHSSEMVVLNRMTVMQVREIGTSLCACSHGRHR
jgi:hypothetical protein